MIWLGTCGKYHAGKPIFQVVSFVPQASISLLCKSMGPAGLLLLILATAAQLLSEAQFAEYPTANISTRWVNNEDYISNLGFNDGSVVRSIVVSSPQTFFGPSFGAGFFCASPCNVFLFAVYIFHIDGIHGESKTARPHVVWSANRARPVREGATVELTIDGNLVLRDADASLVWSSGSSGRSVAGMVITKDSNLVLFDHSNGTVWQSFDHPSDVLLPGQSLLEGTRFVATNWTENQFYMTVLPRGLYGYVESTPPQLYYAYSVWVSENDTGNGPTKVNFVNGSLSLLVQSRQPSNPHMSNISLPAAKSTQYMRLESDGHLRLYEWSQAEATCTLLSDVTKIERLPDDCAFPTVCGEYGICTAGQCTCPFEDNSSSTNYFKLVNGRKANLGCAPLNPISCQEMQHHQLLTLTNVSYFDESHTIENATNGDSCKQACLKNCSCRAVIFRYGLNDSKGDCLWVTKVFSLQSIQPETASFNSSAYLKVQSSPSSAANKKVILGITLALVTTIIFIAIVITVCLLRRGKYEDNDEDLQFDQLPGMPTRFPFDKLRECTEGFNKKLGEGGFGSVFAGKLGEERVAVKRLEGARQGKKEFLAEVETIGSIEHINLVRLIGFCTEKFQRLLVYEYMSGGSLDRWIYYRHDNAPLDWHTRCGIILDIAKGLCYLHEECRRKIAHLDIKPQNILLDENFNAKVADFGLSKLIDRDQSKVMTMMRGTPGYMAPEWLTSQITEKVDVYSFGVVVMELISGRKNIDNSLPEESSHLINLLRGKARDNQMSDLIDEHSEDMLSHQEQVIQMMKLAMWCLLNDAGQRPNMSMVVKVLEGGMSIETTILHRFLNTNTVLPLEDNPNAYSVQTQASILSGPR
ncbi:G-type lectin S-receptor-like serine/threonine-protein kinase SD2-5 [Triticum urartu]|uniref:G-type lectin S-receptor-like serine/threonine-protein kinase SD2-5 n=1 Tax=Triticum urartu TaxID=4572 RepID=UPI0020448AC5|nr:G-type lectin S-receptor-like serine/threonine-protein kinase SD2-5 [Triticum urartu]